MSSSRELILNEATSDPLSFVSDDGNSLSAHDLKDLVKQVIIHEEIRHHEEHREETLILDSPTKKKGYLENIRDSVKYTLISKETEQAITDIYEVMKLFFKDLGFRPIDISMAALVLANYRQTLTIRTNLLITEIERVKELHHFMKFSCASYGWKLAYGYQFKKSLKGLVDGIKLNDAANQAILIEHTGIKKEDIIIERWSSDNTFSPGHYIAVDHSTKSVVVVFRGTFHVRDVMTDLVAGYVPFKGGMAHGGILNAAKELYTKLTPVVIDTLKKNKEYRLIVAGHSLGAGTAALLSMMWNDEFSFHLHCFAYAPPCLVTLDLAMRCKSFVTTVILNDDVIPRLCYGSLEDMKKIIQYLISEESGSSTMHKMYHVLNSRKKDNAKQNHLAKKLGEYLAIKEDSTPDLGITKMTYSDRLHPPGNIIFITKEDDPKVKKPKYDVMEESSPSLFHDLVLSGCMLTDHFPDVYETALLHCLEKIEGK